MKKMEKCVMLITHLNTSLRTKLSDSTHMCVRFKISIIKKEIEDETI